MNYAINLNNKSHRILAKGNSPEPYETVVMADADGWIEWKGGECPLPDDVRAEVEFYDGSHGAAVAHGFWWGTTERLSGTIIAYRPIINTKEKKMNQEWKPEAGKEAQTSGGKCEILAVDNKRGMVSVRWHDGELGTVRIACVKPLLTDRERWIEAACKEVESRASQYNENIACSMAMRMTIETIYDAGLAEMPEGE